MKFVGFVFGMILCANASVYAASVNLDDVPVVAPTYAGVAIANDDAPVVGVGAPAGDASAPTHVDADVTSMPLVSVATDDVLDLSWAGAMELADPLMRPGQIVLPFLQKYPFENLEIKLRLLKLRF